MADFETTEKDEQDPWRPVPKAEGEPEPEPDPEEEFERHRAELQSKGDSGAKWFYGVAALSLVNSLIAHLGGGIYFVVGLGVTLTVDTFANAIGAQDPEIAMPLKVAAIGVDVLAALFVFGLGWLSQKRWTAVFAIGMFLYFLDALIFLMFWDFLSIAFHAFALYGMWQGLSAYRQLNAFDREELLEAELAT